MTKKENILKDHIRETDRRTLIHPYLGSQEESRVVIKRGQGAEIFTSEGTRYLDATGGLWLAQIGHGREELAEVAAKQMKELEYFTTFWDFTNEPAVLLAEKLIDIAPEHIKKVYYTSGGSEGNETTIKAARYYHYKKGEPDRTWILSRKQAYHGLGYASGTATGFKYNHDGFGPLMQDVHHLTPPWPYRQELYDGRSATDFCVAELEETIERIGAGNIAAMIGEPVMGVAGMVLPPEDYWPRIEEVLKKHGILLIFDEVVTAYGRTGNWFASDYYGVKPDMINTAKGISSGYLPLGAVLMTEDVGDTISQDGFPMGFTYSGHPVATAVGLANLNIIENEGLLELAKKNGDYLRGKLDELYQYPIVGEVRNLGMMFAVELVKDKETREPYDKTAQIVEEIRDKEGVIVRDSAHTIVLSPPLNITNAESDEIAAALDAVIKRFA